MSIPNSVPSCPSIWAGTPSSATTTEENPPTVGFWARSGMAVAATSSNAGSPPPHPSSSPEGGDGRRVGPDWHRTSSFRPPPPPPPRAGEHRTHGNGRGAAARLQRHSGTDRRAGREAGSAHSPGNLRRTGSPGRRETRRQTSHGGRPPGDLRSPAGQYGNDGQRSGHEHRSIDGEAPLHLGLAGQSDRHPR